MDVSRVALTAVGVAPGAACILLIGGSAHAPTEAIALLGPYAVGAIGALVTTMGILIRQELERGALSETDIDRIHRNLVGGDRQMVPPFVWLPAPRMPSGEGVVRCG